MQEATLPSPDTGSHGFHLRRVAVKNISQLEMVARGYPNGAHPGAAKLAAFFDACRLAALEVGKQDVPATLTPTTSTGAAGSTQQLTLGKGSSTGAVTYKSSDTSVATVNSAGLVTRVKTGSVTITATIAPDTNFRGETITATVTVA
jgi:hypothetical protein